MEIADIRNQLTQMNEKIISFRGLFDLDQLEEDIAGAEQMADPTFWDDSEKAQQVINANNANKETYDQFNQLAEEDERASDVGNDSRRSRPEMEAELEARITKLNEKMASYELSMLLDEPYDRNNAIIELHPGAGGTESQDWGSMLLRMYYSRFCEQHGYQVETLDYQAGDEAGSKVSFTCKGHNAYGYLKSEKKAFIV